MPTLADILAGIDSVVTPAKRRLSDMIRNPLASAQQTVGLLGDRAQEFDRDIGLGVDRRALQNAGSVMAGAPQYVDADRRTVDRMNSMIGSFAPIGMTVSQGPRSAVSMDDVRKIRDEWRALDRKGETALAQAAFNEYRDLLRQYNEGVLKSLARNGEPIK